MNNTCTDVNDFSGKWPLSNYGLLAIGGPDARAFLHSQLTSSITDLGPGQARPFAYCSAQGRVLANGLVYASSTDKFLMAIASDLIQTIKKRLQLFVLRSKVIIEETSSYAMFGAYSEDYVPAQIYAADPWSCYAEGDSVWIASPATNPQAPAAWLLQTSPIDAVTPIKQQLASSPEAFGNAWDAYLISAGWPSIQALTEGVFLPAALAMDKNGTIDFNKGCYPGQEVIARSHYRGVSKRALGYAAIDWDQSTAPVAAGADIYPADAGNGAQARTIGRVIATAWHNSRLHLALEVPTPAADANVDHGLPGFRLQAADGILFKLNKYY